MRLGLQPTEVGDRYSRDRSQAGTALAVDVGEKSRPLKFDARETKRQEQSFSVIVVIGPTLAHL